ncbi:MAG: hypothetical protein KDA28_06955, partial [Phycisphaerales bacterium]|nr:hypothetical protein [Phycisphaerales bacterium]
MMMKSTLSIGLTIAFLLVSAAAYAQTEDPSEADDTVVEDAPTVRDSPRVEEEEEPAPPTRTGLSGSDGVNYDLRLQELEDRVNELKEEIFRSKSRLFLLRQQILQDNIGGSRAI